MFSARPLTLLCLLVCEFACCAQTAKKFNDSNLIFSRDACKHFYFSYILTSEVFPEIKSSSNQAKQIPFLKIHGRVTYDYFYRSKIDTPFAQQNLQQHT